MTCNEIHELMPDLAAGMIEGSPELNQHLQDCTVCRNKIEEMRQTMALLDEWRAPEPSPYFGVRLQARLREEMASHPPGWLQWMRKPALAVALTLLVVVGGTVITRNGANLRSASSTVAGPLSPPIRVEPGTAVGDLQALEKNHDLYADFDMLDDLQVQEDVVANP
jgi:predicted anti-sigma-YlaC factor YlaD